MGNAVVLDNRGSKERAVQQPPIRVGRQAYSQTLQEASAQTGSVSHGSWTPSKRGCWGIGRALSELPLLTLPLLWPRKGGNGWENWGLCAESHILSAHLKSLHASIPLAPISAQAWPYRTSAFRRLPAGPPESRAAPDFLRHGREKWKAGWDRTQWVSGLGRPLALRQSLHPAAQTAEEIGGGGGREQRRSGGGEREGAEEGRSWSAKAGSGEMGEESLWGEAAREGDESWRRRERRVRGLAGVGVGDKSRKLYSVSGSGVSEAPWGPLCPILCQLPTPDVFILAASTGSAPSPQWETLPAQ